MSDQKPLPPDISVFSPLDKPGERAGGRNIELTNFRVVALTAVLVLIAVAVACFA